MSTQRVRQWARLYDKEEFMESDLKISMIQAPIAWEERHANLDFFERQVASLAGGSDLVILPEMFTTGFSMAPQRLADTMEGETMTTIRRWAATYGLAVAGSFIAEEEEHYYNRAFFVEPNGTISCYDKRHLFSMAGENKHYTPGTRPTIVAYRGWNIALFVCYDLRFPVWSRNVGAAYDLALYMANWPEARAPVWKPLLMARAIENQVYVCGVNRSGVDGHGFPYRGDSVVYSPKGKALLDAGNEELFAETTLLSKSELETFRRKFPVGSDADAFTLK